MAPSFRARPWGPPAAPPRRRYGNPDPAPLQGRPDAPRWACRPSQAVRPAGQERRLRTQHLRRKAAVAARVGPKQTRARRSPPRGLRPARKPPKSPQGRLAGLPVYWARVQDGQRGAPNSPRSRQAGGAPALPTKPLRAASRAPTAHHGPGVSPTSRTREFSPMPPQVACPPGPAQPPDIAASLMCLKRRVPARVQAAPCATLRVVPTTTSTKPGVRELAGPACAAARPWSWLHSR